MKNRFFGYAVIVILILFSISNIAIFFKKEVKYQTVSKEHENLKQTYDKKRIQLEQLEVGDNKERYFREQYNVSKKGEILFEFPEDYNEIVGS